MPEEEMEQRADILIVGTVVEAEDGQLHADGWAFEGGTAAGMNYSTGRVCGWSLDELRVIFVLWNAYRFPLPIPGAQFGPVPSVAQRERFQVVVTGNRVNDDGQGISS